MIRTLTGPQARLVFDELAVELPKQHLRFQFRKRFGTGELLNPAMFKRNAHVFPRAKPLTNVLQEVPDTVVSTRLLGTADSLRGDRQKIAIGGTIGDLFADEEVEQLVIVQGRKARLYAYSDPSEDSVCVLRVVSEIVGEEKKGSVHVVPAHPVVPSRPSRKKRARLIEQKRSAG